MDCSDVEQLKGIELSGVFLVRDYIELHFDGPVLRLLGDASVRSGREETLSEDERFCGLIRACIGDEVKKVLSSGNQLEIVFSGGHSVCVGGRELGSEFAHFISFPSNQMQIWQVD